MQQDGSDGVRYDRAMDLQDAVAVPHHAAHLEFCFEVGRIIDDHFQEQSLVFEGQMVPVLRRSLPAGLPAN